MDKLPQGYRISDIVGGIIMTKKNHIFVFSKLFLKNLPSVVLQTHFLTTCLSSLYTCFRYQLFRFYVLSLGDKIIVHWVSCSFPTSIWDGSIFPIPWCCEGVSYLLLQVFCKQVQHNCDVAGCPMKNIPLTLHVVDTIHVFRDQISHPI